MLRSFKAELLCAGVVFFVSLAVYSWTLAPTVTLVDSGELIVAARSLGIAHPPGFPLYLVLAHLASLVPVGNIAMRVNFASALFGALACALLTLVVAELMIIGSYRGLKRKTARKSKKISPQAISADDAASNALMVLVPALVSGLLMAFSRTLWSYATIAEVYTLNTLLILIIFLLMLRWRRRIIEDERRMNTNPDSTRPAPAIPDHDFLLYAAAFVFGLALGVHHVTVALMLPALAGIVYKTEGRSFFASKRLLYAAFLSLGALLAVYSYLPLAASRTPIISWGDPRSLEKIWWHITGKQYQVFLSFTPQIIDKQAVEFGKLALHEFGFWWLPLVLAVAIIGFANAFKRDRTTFWFLALIVIGDLAYTLCYDIAEDKNAYYLPTFISITIAAGFGARWFLQLVLSKPTLSTKMYTLAAFPALLLPAIALAGNWPFNNRRHYYIARDYVENILSAIEPNGLLLTLDWQVASPTLYVREVEEHRRDVKVVDLNLLRRSWYFDYLRRAYPDLIERSNDKVDAYLTDLKQWEHNPTAYTKSTVMRQSIASAFQEMVQSFVTRQFEIAPVYVTPELVLMVEEENRELTQWLTQNYQAFPRGLVFQLAADRRFHDPNGVHLQTRGLTDGTISFDKDDVVSIKVLPTYKIMLVNRARYLAFFNQHERAVEAFKQALAFDPTLQLAREGLDQSMNKLRTSGPSH